MSCSPDRREGGFLLLEVIVALAIIGLVAVALLGATSAQVNAAARSSRMMVAGALAQDRLAWLRILDADDLEDPPASLLAGTFPAPFEEFSWTSQVTPTDNETDLYAVRVEVTGRGERFVLETLVHRSSAVVTTDAGGGGGGGGGGTGGGRGEGGARGGGGEIGRAHV